MARVAVLDIDSIAYAIANPNKIKNDDGSFALDEKGRFIYVDKTQSELESSCHNVLKDILESCLAEEYIGFIKGNNTGKHRYAIKTDYKSNRSDLRPHWWDFVSHYLTQNFNIHIVDNYEVDDIVNVYRLNKGGAFIVAIDKDLLNLPGVHFNWKTKEWQANTYQEAERSFWIDMIAGQPGDAIKGIPKKGKVFAESVLGEDIEKYPYIVLEQYIKYLPNGISDFSKNYACLKILDDINTIEFDFSKIGSKSVRNILEKGGLFETK